MSGWRVLRSDVVRKELAGLPTHTPAGASYGEGLYTPETRAAVYRELLVRARDALELGESVVLDASWLEPDRRTEAETLATETMSDLVQLRCRAPRTTAAERLRRRQGGTDASDTGPEVAEAMDEAAGAWPRTVIIDTADDPEDAVKAASSAVGDWPAG